MWIFNCIVQGPTIEDVLSCWTINSKRLSLPDRYLGRPIPVRTVLSAVPHIREVSMVRCEKNGEDTSSCILLGLNFDCLC